MKARESAVQVGSLVLYFVVSLLAIFLNKSLLADLSPLSVTAHQSAVGTVFLLPVMFRYRASLVSTLTLSLPGTVVQTAMLLLNNFCLSTSSLPVYQIARSMTPVFAMVLTGSSLTSAKGAGCLLLVGGFCLGQGLGTTQGLLLVSLPSGITGLASSFLVALYSVVSASANRAIKAKPGGGGTLELMAASSFLSSLLLVPLAWFLSSPVSLSPQVILSGAMGLAIQSTIMNLIAVLGPVAYGVAGLAKASLQSLLGPIIFQDKVVWTTWVGLGLSLLGTGIFSFAR